MNKRADRVALLSLLLCLLISLQLAPRAQADFGGYSGDTDYGGSSSYDYGGSSSYDSYDYGGSSYDSYDYSSGSGYHGGGSGFSVEGLLSFLVLVALVLGLRALCRSMIYGVGGLFTKKSKPKPEGARRTAGSRLRPMGDLSVLDENFGPAALTEKLSNLYVQMQNCWTDRRLDSLRPYFTDTLYAQMARQVSIMKQQGRTNYVERIAVLGVELRGFFQAGGEDHLIAELRTRIVDYTLDDRTGKLLSGHRTKEKFMTYEWELTRPTGSRTRISAEMNVVNCPNCGAPVSINQSAECPYCGSVIELQTHDWAISAIRGIAQRTGR